MKIASQLVRRDSVHKSVYVDPDIFELEMTHVFGKAWIVLGHVSMLPQIGGWFTARLGREPVIVYNGEENTVRVFYNRCPHRGATLCSGASGISKRLQCPYHGWTFDPQGTLLAVPAKDEYDPDFFDGRNNLTQVARVAVYRGFIFASLSKAGPDLLEFLGEARSIIDEMVDRAPDGDLEVIRSVHRHSYRGNWKMQFENLNDTVHPAFSHASSIAAAQNAVDSAGADGLTPELRVMLANGQPISFFQNNNMVVTDFGHSFIDGHIAPSQETDLTLAYRAAMIERKGETETDRIVSANRHVMLLYPSSTWQARFQTLKIVVPVAVDRTDTITYVFRLKGAPDAMLGQALPYANMANSAASPIIADDLELYERCMSGNSASGAEWVSTSRRLSTDEAGAFAATSEQYIRSQFSNWAKYMGGE